MAKDEAQRERAAAAAEVSARLRSRGVAVTGGESPEDLVDLLAAVERFEAAVEAHGGDLMVRDLKSSGPADQHFPVPPRWHRAAIPTHTAPNHQPPPPLRPPPRQPDSETTTTDDL